MKTNYIISLLTIIIATIFLSQTTLAQAVFTSKSNGGGNINAVATWTKTGVDADNIPDANDDIVIETGDKIVINGAASVKNITIKSAGATPGKLVWGGAFTITVAGNITFTYTAGTKPTLSIDNAGTLANGCKMTFKGVFVNASNGIIEFWKTGATTGAMVDYNSASPTTQTIVATDYGTFRLSGTGNKILPSSGNVTIRATSATCMQNATTGVITNTGSTIEYAGSGAQTIINFNYNNLKSSGAGARTINGTTVKIAGTYTPGTNTYTVTGSTITFNGTTGTVSGTGAVFNNFTINAGCTFTAPSTFRVNGNFTNNGTSFVHSSGTVVFGGAVTQNLTGTTSTTLYNMTVNASAIVKLGIATNLENVMTMGASSQFNTNAKTFTLKSTATNTASIANLPATVTFTGNVVLERYIPGPLTGWVLLGTPLTGRTLADWLDDFAMSGFTGSSGAAGSGGFVSVYTYDEAQPGIREAAAKYIAATNITNTITVGKGFWCYVGDDVTTTSNITVDVTGAITRNNQNITVKYTNNNPGAPVEDGWNLIANPYPSAISFSSLYTANSAKIQNYYLVYNADLGDYATYDNSTATSTPALNSGGVGNNIPSSRAFYVQTLAAIAPSTTLGFTEAMKSATNNETFVRTANPLNANNNLFRINVSDGVRNNDCAIRFTENASNQLDNMDIPKFKTKQQWPTDMLIYSSFNKTNYSVNSMSSLKESVKIPIGIKVGTTKKYTISGVDINNVIPQEHCVRLYDTYTGVYTNIRKDSYTCILSDTTTQNRFELVIDLRANELVTVNTLQANATQQNGAIQINTTLPNYNYVVTSKTDNVIISSQNGVVKNATIENLPQGNYLVEINNNTCVTINETHTINSFELPVAATEQIQKIDQTEIPLGLENKESPNLNCFASNKMLTIASSDKLSSNAILQISTITGQILVVKQINEEATTAQYNMNNLPEQVLLVTIIDGNKKYSKVVTNK